MDSNPRFPREDEPREKARWILSHRRIAKPRTHARQTRGEEGGFELLGCRPPGAPFFFRGQGGAGGGRLGLARPSNNHANIAKKHRVLRSAVSREPEDDEGAPKLSQFKTGIIGQNHTNLGSGQER